MLLNIFFMTYSFFIINYPKIQWIKILNINFTVFVDQESRYSLAEYCAAKPLTIKLSVGAALLSRDLTRGQSHSLGSVVQRSASICHRAANNIAFGSQESERSARWKSQSLQNLILEATSHCFCYTLLLQLSHQSYTPGEGIKQGWGLQEAGFIGGHARGYSPQLFNSSIIFQDIDV